MLTNAPGFRLDPYFRRRATNASAEAFNSKVKIFRSQMRGVRDRDFFIFRLVKLYA
ncbi:transposase [Paramuribaculum intestinale]|uniref:transposase n=1 Tax=Paramuribaculum intestinale TaxID=2094151 RepID=UPI003F4A26E0